MTHPQEELAGLEIISGQSLVSWFQDIVRLQSVAVGYDQEVASLEDSMNLLRLKPGELDVDQDGQLSPQQLGKIGSVAVQMLAKKELALSARETRKNLRKALGIYIDESLFGRLASVREISPHAAAINGMISGRLNNRLHVTDYLYEVTGRIGRSSFPDDTLSLYTQSRRGDRMKSIYDIKVVNKAAKPLVEIEII